MNVAIKISPEKSFNGNCWDNGLGLKTEKGCVTVHEGSYKERARRTEGRREKGWHAPCLLTVWNTSLIARNATRASNRAKHTYSTRRQCTLSWHTLMTRKKKNKNARGVARNFMALQLWTITCVRSTVLSSNASNVTCTAHRAGRSRMPWKKFARNFDRYFSCSYHNDQKSSRNNGSTQNPFKQRKNFFLLSGCVCGLK